MTDRLPLAALVLALLGTTVVDAALPFPAQSGVPVYLWDAVWDTGQQGISGVPAPDEDALLASPLLPGALGGGIPAEAVDIESVAPIIDDGVEGAGTTAPATTPVVERTSTPEPISDRSGYLRRMSVRLTYYVDQGRMYTGYRTFWGAASVDPRVIPHGTLFRIVGDEVLRVALDTGGLVQGPHTDIWMPSDQAGREFIRQYGEYTEIEILQEAR